MNEQTPRTPGTPDNTETTPLPESMGRPAADPTFSAADPAPTTPPAPAAAPAPRSSLRPLLIGAGAAAAVLLIGGAGAAIALSLNNASNDRDDFSRVSETVSPGNGDDRSRETDDGGASGPNSPNPVPSAGAERAPSDAASLADAIDAAIAEAAGTGATSIEVERGGWDVDVVLDDRREIDVFVELDGTATVRDTGTDNDRDSDPLLDTARISAIADAAIAAAGGGTIESISTDDGRVRYEVSVDLGNGRDAEVELAESLEVLSLDDD